jgi:hypothetical protein
MNDSGSDKGTAMEGWEAHGYTPYYEQWFEPIREEPLRLLEIGVCDPRNPGASVNGWYEYFPNAQLFGFDIVDATRFDNDRITTFKGDQSREQDLSRFIEEHGSGFDIIIDDGSHVDQHQQASLGFLFDHLKPHGQYIIEDMQVSPDTAQLLVGLRHRLEFPAWQRILKDRVNSLGDLVLNSRNAPRYLSRKVISHLSQEIESIELFCDNKLARLVKL